MCIYLYDRLYEPDRNVTTAWQGSLSGVFDQYNLVENGRLIAEQGDGVFFVHGDEDALASTLSWLLGRPAGRFVVLVGSGDTPKYRELGNGGEGEKWGFCPWSAEDIRATKRQGIKEFIASVQKGRPNFSLFNACEPEILRALAILAQGYLIVHAAADEDADLIPENLQKVAGSCSREVPVKKVQAHAFWDVFDGKKTEELTKAATREWKGLGGGNGLDTDIENLIKAAADEGGGTIAGKEAVAMVKGVYEAIEAKFGANRGK
jgi:hypothetical protein